MGKHDGPACGKPTASGATCRVTGWCGAHPDPPMDQFRKIIAAAEQGRTREIDNLGVEYRISRVVNQITENAQNFLDFRIRKVMQEGIRTGRPREEIQEEIRELRAVLESLRSWE